MAKSLVDYIFRWLEKQFAQTKSPKQSKASTAESPIVTLNEQFANFQSDAPICIRSGSCYLCHNCGRSLGCS